MQWESRYLPPDWALWSGRTDTPKDACFYQHTQLIDLRSEQPPQVSANGFALIGFKCDEGIKRDSGRIGAAEGPDAIRQRLARLPIQKPHVRLYDLGDITCPDSDLDASQTALAELVRLSLQHNLRPLIIGGGHELAWGHYQGIAHYLQQEQQKHRLGIINFDAHFDLQPLHEKRPSSSTTTFYQIAEAQQANQSTFDYSCVGIQHAGNIRQLFDIAKRFKTKVIFADELHQGLQEKCFDFIDRIVDQNDLVYMSVSLDVFAPAFAPGVSSIQPLGLNPWHIIPLIRQLAASAKVIGYDIADCAPCYDIDHRTAKLAATLIYEIVHHHNEHPRTW